MTKAERVVRLAHGMRRKLDSLSLEFSGYIYDPLSYAGEMHDRYLAMSVREDQKVMFLGMNPGPFGMMQTGVPFGDIDSVKGFLGLDGTVKKPHVMCPERPVEGMATTRREMSGRRIWGAVESEFTRDEFFDFAAVMNWCPLCFLDDKGRNVTPDKLSKEDRAKFYPICDEWLGDVIRVIDPDILVGIGNFTAGRMRGFGKEVIVMPHPSPLNRGSAAFYPEEAARFMRGLYEKCVR